MSAILDGVVLAAGRSSRMQAPKPLLEIGPETFLERTVQILRSGGCRRVYVVVATEEELPAALSAAADVEIVINARRESEQVDSLRLAVERLPADTRGVLVLPVDLPLVSPDTARRVGDAFRARPGPLFVPFHNTVAGHPVLLGRELFDDIMHASLEEGVRSLIMSHARTLEEVRVVDPGILIDIDTPDDYWRYIEQK
jgi:molybdenum cofactor cytidylyltransferase